MKKGWVWKSHVMQIRQMLQKIWYQTLFIHSTYWFDQSMFCPFFFVAKTAFFGFQSSELYFLLFSFSFFLMKFFVSMDSMTTQQV